MPARPERNAANSSRVMCSGFGAPIGTRRVPGVIPDSREQSQRGCHPEPELLLAVDDERAEAARPGRGEDAVAVQVQRAGVGAVEVLLELGQPQPRVGDDPVELVDQGRLRERRQLLERDLAPAGLGAERLPVVGRGGGRVREQIPQALSLEVEQLLA